MKKIIVCILFFGSYFMLFAQNQSNNLEELQKQVSVIKTSNYKQKARLNSFIKTSENAHDSLQDGLNKNIDKIVVLSDTLMSLKSQVTVLKDEVEKLKKDISSVKTSNAIQYIILILLIILLIFVYYQLSDKIKKLKEKLEKNISGTKEQFESELNKTNKEVKQEVSSLKGEIQEKIDDINKRISSLHK